MCFPMERAVEKKWDFEGLQCIVTRADLVPGQYSAHRCGYVRVPPGHPWHGTAKDLDIDVHGGITFGEIEPCAHDDGTGYWIGFDCHHSGDAGFPGGDPRREIHFSFDHDDSHYWTLEEVQAETERLAQQVKAAA